MKLIEKVPLQDYEYQEYKEACKNEGRSLRQQTAKLIRDFLITLKK